MKEKGTCNEVLQLGWFSQFILVSSAERVTLEIRGLFTYRALYSRPPPQLLHDADELVVSLAVQELNRKLCCHCHCGVFVVAEPQQQQLRRPTGDRC